MYFSQYTILGNFPIFDGNNAVTEADGTFLVAYDYAGAVFEVSYVGEHFMLCGFVESRGCLVEQKNGSA